jgi:hypothetical protein
MNANDYDNQFDSEEEDLVIQAAATAAISAALSAIQYTQRHLS